MVHGVAKLAFIDDAIGIIGDAATCDVSVKPVTLKGASIRENDLAGSRRFARDKITLINRPIWETRRAFAANLAVNPVACVFIPIGQTVRTSAVLFPIEEGALVNATIVILLGLNGLRREACGTQREKSHKSCFLPSKTVHMLHPVRVNS